MNISATKTNLKLDDYLDLLNLAVSIGDEKWQKEIVRKLSYTYPSSKLVSNK
ncbi:hypothetical protein PV403_18810 [Paenibacillus sp. GYB006]|uniref:hypothetical protein n=1 Tax=Paenibacillus sp. GYB006 TaxID=2994394 RepID=UPI002F96A59B